MEVWDYLRPGVYRVDEDRGSAWLPVWNVRAQTTYFAEVLIPSGSTADIALSVEVDPDGSGPLPWLCADTIRFTGVRADLEVQGFGEDRWVEAGAIVVTQTEQPNDPEPVFPNLTPGPWLKHRLVVRDPRDLAAMGRHYLRIQGLPDDLPLWGARRSWTSDPFMAVDSMTGNPGPGAPPTGWVPQGRAIEFEYNPIWPFTRLQGDLPWSPHIKKIVREVARAAKGMETGPNAWVPGGDDGAFGRELHRRVLDVLGERPNWHTRVWVRVEDKMIMSIGPSPGIEGVRKFDAVHVRSGYVPRVGETLRVADVVDAFDIKTATGILTGQAAAEQIGELKQVLGGRSIRLVGPSRTWRPTGGWQPHTKWARIAGILGVVGGASSVSAMVQTDGQVEFFEGVVVPTIQRYRNVSGSPNAHTVMEAWTDVVEVVREWILMNGFEGQLMVEAIFYKKLIDAMTLFH